MSEKNETSKPGEWEIHKCGRYMTCLHCGEKVKIEDRAYNSYEDEMWAHCEACGTSHKKKMNYPATFRREYRGAA